MKRFAAICILISGCLAFAADERWIVSSGSDTLAIKWVFINFKELYPSKAFDQLKNQQIKYAKAYEYPCTNQFEFFHWESTRVSSDIDVTWESLLSDWRSKGWTDLLWTGKENDGWTKYLLKSKTKSVFMMVQFFPYKGFAFGLCPTSMK